MSLDRQILDFCRRPRSMPLARASLCLQNALWKNWGRLLSGRVKSQVSQESRSSPSVLTECLGKCVPRQANIVPLSAFVHPYANMPSISNAGLMLTSARKKAGGLRLDVYIISYNQICLAYHGHIVNSVRLVKRHRYRVKFGHMRIPH